MKGEILQKLTWKQKSNLDECNEEKKKYNSTTKEEIRTECKKFNELEVPYIVTKRCGAKSHECFTANILIKISILLTN